MAKVRWTGDGDREVMVAVDDDYGGTRVEQVDFPRMEWRDVPVEVARSLNAQEGWEMESVKKAAETRAANDHEKGGD